MTGSRAGGTCAEYEKRIIKAFGKCRYVIQKKECNGSLKR